MTVTLSDFFPESLNTLQNENGKKTDPGEMVRKPRAGSGGNHAAAPTESG